MKNRTTQIIAGILLLLSFLLSGCGTQNSFMSAVKSENYSKAIEIYEKKIAGNSGEEMTAQNELKDYLEHSWNSFVSGSISSAEFQSIFRCLQEINDRLWILPELYWMEYEYEMIDASKSSFADGIEFSKNGDYDAAMQAFEQVVPEDTENYENAIREEAKVRGNYLTGIEQSAKTLAAAGSYDEALTLVADAKIMLGYCDELLALEMEITTKQYSDAVERAYQFGDRLSVVRLCEEALENPSVELSADLTRMYSESKAMYVQTVVDSARRAFENGRDYETACALLRNAIGEASFSSELLAELEPILEEYSAYAPVALTSLSPVRKGEYIMVGDNWTSSDTNTDVNGKVYDSNGMVFPLETGFSLASEQPKNDDDSAITYMLNYQYSSLSGIVFRPYGTLSSDDWNGNNGTVKIYGDGVLLYEANPVSQTTWDTEDFALDVAGVRELKIVIVGRWVENGGSLGIYERHPKVCLADLMLQK